MSQGVSGSSVAALIARWREDAKDMHNTSAPGDVLLECADELESALLTAEAGHRALIEIKADGSAVIGDMTIIPLHGYVMRPRIRGWTISGIDHTMTQRSDDAEISIRAVKDQEPPPLTFASTTDALPESMTLLGPDDLFPEREYRYGFDGNPYIFCDAVQNTNQACVRGAGHSGPHLFTDGEVPLVPVKFQPVVEPRP